MLVPCIIHLFLAVRSGKGKRRQAFSLSGHHPEYAHITSVYTSVLAAAYPYNHTYLQRKLGNVIFRETAHSLTKNLLLWEKERLDPGMTISSATGPKALFSFFFFHI